MNKLLLLIVASLAFCNSARSWEEDVSKNFQVTPTGLNYFESEVRTNKDGTTYIFMMCPGSPNISMRLQIISPDGLRLFPRSGEVISQEPNNTWFGFNRYLELDKDGDVFIGVQDYRKNIEKKLSTYSLYKYTSAGTKLLDGIVLNDGVGCKLPVGLSMCAVDGGCVSSYTFTDEEKNEDHVVVEKIGDDGRSLWKRILYKSGAFTYPYSFLCDAGDGKVLVLVAFGGEIKAELLDADGSDDGGGLETVYDGGFASSKVWEVMQLQELAGHKVALSLVGGDKQGRLLVLDGNGKVILNGDKKGVLLNDDLQYASDVPSVVYDEAEDAYTCCYKVFDDENTDFSSLKLQKISGGDGRKLWSGQKDIVAFQQSDIYGYYVMRGMDDGRYALFYLKMNALDYNDVKGYMQVIDADGTPDAEPVPFTTASGNKQNLHVSEFVNGHFIASWDDRRSSQTSLFMQAISPAATTSIQKPKDNGCEAEVLTRYFSVDGMRLDKPRKGLNIVRKGDNSVV